MKEELNINWVSNPKKGSFTITPLVEEQRKLLCKLSPNKEWQGLVIAEVEQHDINKEEFHYKILEIFPTYIANGMRFSAQWDATVSLYAAQRGYDLTKIFYGVVHSHCSIATNPSGTDDSDLKNRCKEYNFYLSLITNNQGSWSGRIGIFAESKVTTEVNSIVLNSAGKKTTKKNVVENTKNHCLVYELNALKEIQLVDKEDIINLFIEESYDLDEVFDLVESYYRSLNPEVPEEFLKKMEEIEKEYKERNKPKNTIVDYIWPSQNSNSNFISNYNLFDQPVKATFRKSKSLYNAERLLVEFLGGKYTPDNKNFYKTLVFRVYNSDTHSLEQFYTYLESQNMSHEVITSALEEVIKTIEKNCVNNRYLQEMLQDYNYDKKFYI